MSRADIHNTNTDRTMKGRPRPNTQKPTSSSEGGSAVLLPSGLRSVFLCVCVCLSVCHWILVPGLSGSNEKLLHIDLFRHVHTQANQLGPRSQ